MARVKNLKQAPVEVPTLITDAISRPAILGEGALFKIDRSICVDGFALVSGWCTRGLDIDGELVEKIVFYRRPDAEAQLGDSVLGFVLAAEVSESDNHVSLNLTESGTVYTIEALLQKDPHAVTQTLSEQGARIATLIDPLARSPKWGAIFARMITNDRQTAPAAGCIDSAVGASGIGGVVQGWIYAREECDLWLVSGADNWRTLSDAIRFHRPDIIDAFPADFAYTQEAGFVSSLMEEITQKSELRLVAANSRGIWQLYQGAWTSWSAEPKDFSRQAFQYPTPYGKFIDRLERHDGPIIEQLLANAAPSFEPEPMMLAIGEQPEQPAVSIIVPLYGRADFMQHQLLAFSKDPDFMAGTVDLIYVIDDVKLIEYVRANIHVWHELYRIPFRVVWGGRNRGFSGANNFGVQFANAETFIFLNSDIFPRKSGWVSQIVGELADRPEVVAVGARLEFPDGSIQHLGMDFEWDEDLALWLNVHPQQGLMVPMAADGERIEAPSVTGACLGVRRADYEEVGGFDEGYLIGDFEDSDLCLKLSQAGGKCVVLADTKLVHLVRQSFVTTGDTSFRQRVVFFNAWLHSKRWGETILTMKQN